MFRSNVCLFVFLVLLYFHLILQFSEELRGSGCLRPQRSGFAESGRCLRKLDHSGLNFIMCQDLYSVSPTVKLCVHCDLRFVSIRIGLDLIIVTVISRRWWWFMVFLVIKVIVCLFLLVSYYWFHFDFRYATRSIYFYNYLFVLFENNSLTLSETAWVIVRTFNMLFSFSLALHFVRKLFIMLFLYQISICIITGIICNGTV